MFHTASEDAQKDAEAIMPALTKSMLSERAGEGEVEMSTSLRPRLRLPWSCEVATIARAGHIGKSSLACNVAGFLVAS